MADIKKTISVNDDDILQLLNALGERAVAIVKCGTHFSRGEPIRPTISGVIDRMTELVALLPNEIRRGDGW
jgi:hypothetical protein